MMRHRIFWLAHSLVALFGLAACGLDLETRFLARAALPSDADIPAIRQAVEQLGDDWKLEFLAAAPEKLELFDDADAPFHYTLFWNEDPLFTATNIPSGQQVRVLITKESDWSEQQLEGFVSATRKSFIELGLELVESGT